MAEAMDESLRADVDGMRDCRSGGWMDVVLML